MISGILHEDVYITSEHQVLVQQALTASRRASEKLNNAMRFQQPNIAMQSNGVDYHTSVSGTTQLPSHHNRDKKRASISITSLTNDDRSDPIQVTHLSIRRSPSDQHVGPLPSLNARSPVAVPTVGYANSMSQSPSLSKYAISPQEFDPSQTLARIQSHPSTQSNHASPAEFKQTLPSLETALSSVSDMPSAYADSTSAISRHSPNHLSPFGRSPPGYSHTAASMSLSPPRLPAHPTTWRTLSQNSSNSTMSDRASVPGSNAVSTPASSVPRHSPAQSMATPQYQDSERHVSPGSDIATLTGSEDHDDASLTNINPQGYSCPWPGCTAPPFQTQYLLNSHTNVHSNTRPHFCPVKDCPRGPGGQGFKRKNEMIRHGLVHQSPGYICPFCVDQQHKYPRPDNLQRHVRVHHVDKDRDDPLLRDVLAQRPEGGNRGRRRRLGA